DQLALKVDQRRTGVESGPEIQVLLAPGIVLPHSEAARLVVLLRQPPGDQLPSDLLFVQRGFAPRAPRTYERTVVLRQRRAADKLGPLGPVDLLIVGPCLLDRSVVPVAVEVLRQGVPPADP